MKGNPLGPGISEKDLNNFVDISTLNVHKTNRMKLLLNFNKRPLFVIFIFFKYLRSHRNNVRHPLFTTWNLFIDTIKNIHREKTTFLNGSNNVSLTINF